MGSSLSDSSFQVVGRVINEGPLEIGGETVTAYYLNEYRGKVCIMTDDGEGRIVAVMPTVEEGLRVARYAITPDGGFGCQQQCKTDPLAP